MVPNSKDVKEFYDFEDFRLDRGQRVLMRQGQVFPLAPKAFDTLLVLVENRERVVGKDELMNAVWPDAFVEEGSLTQNISVLRKVLGEGAGGRQFIQTIPKRGYRFVAPLREEEVAEEAGVPAPKSITRYVAVPVLALVLGLAAYLAWRHWRAPVLTDQDVLVLAEFANSTGDPAFDSILREALAFQLEQSPFLRVLDDVVVRQDLQLMRHSPQEFLTRDLAHDVCIREAEKAMLSGSIANLGKTYLIEIQATNCETGATLAREQAEAKDKDHVLDALAQAAQSMRAKLGESLGSIELSAPPRLAQRVTTNSLEAFQAYQMGSNLYTAGRFSEAVPELEKATELDPNLAMAWVVLATIDSDRADYAAKAWALRDQVSPYERLWITSGKSGQTLDQYTRDFEEWRRAYPRDPFPVIALGRIHRAGGRFEEALPLYQTAVRLAAHNPIYSTDLIAMYRNLDRFAEARAVAKTFPEDLDAPNLHGALLLTAYGEGNASEAAREIEWYKGRPEEYLSLGTQANQAKWLGRIRESRALLQRAADLATRRKLPDAAAGLLRPDYTWEALLGNCVVAQKTALPFDTIVAFCGDAAMNARSEAMDARIGTGYMANPAQLTETRAAEEFRAGHFARSIELLREVAPFERAYPVAIYLRGSAYLRLHQGADAAAEFQKIVDHRGANWGPFYPLSYLGLARAAAMAGDKARAAAAYRAVLELWKDADADFTPMIEAKKEFKALGWASGSGA